MVDFAALNAKRKAQVARKKAAPPPVVLDEVQQGAVDLAMAGKNLFVTGAGGVGKSETVQAIVRTLRQAGKTVAVCASTGVAAINVRGTTVHSFLKTGIMGSIAELSNIVGPKMIDDAKDRIGDVDVIVVDEVSMLTGDYLDMMHWWLNLVSDMPLTRYSPFGGYQVVFVGDFLQLPPVITGPVACQFAFESSAWKNAELECIHLTRVYRQDDAELLKHLHEVRMGAASPATLAYFNKRVFAPLPETSKEPVRLFATNAAVDKVNEERLERLSGKEHLYPALTEGHPSWQEAIRKNAPCEEELRLRVGARVIFIRNNWLLKFHNGLCGVVTDLAPEFVAVTSDDGRTHRVPVETWEMLDSNRRVLATITQFPLRLAWALTIHKSQGMTLDNLEADLSQVFERGQAYVALSRVRSLAGLRLLAPLSILHVRAAKKVVKFYEEFS
jgi:ATP-dependent exoDNAse (exonuclease V) alpha subunit